MCMHLRNAEKLKENAISETVCRISLSVKAEYCCLRMFLLIYYRCCHVGNWLLLVRFSSACAGTGPVRWISKLFFFLLLQVPSSEQYLRRLQCRKKQKEERKKAIHQLSSFLNCSTLPLSFLSRVISTQVFGKTKKVLLLLHAKQITHLLNCKANVNPFSGVSFEHSS